MQQATSAWEACGGVISPSLHRLYAALDQPVRPEAQAEAQQLVASIAGAALPRRTSCLAKRTAHALFLTSPLPHCLYAALDWLVQQEVIDKAQQLVASIAGAALRCRTSCSSRELPLRWS